MKENKINGIAVYDSENGKTPLIFVHAFPLNSKMWNKQVEEFSENYRVITYDTRGLGKSASKNNQNMMEHYADDLINIIDTLKIEKINAVGLSMGGYIIQRALLKREEIFKTVTLADTKLGRDSNEGLISRAAAIDKILKGKRKEFVDGFIPNLISEESFKNPSLVNNIQEMIADSTDEGIAGAILVLATKTDNTGAFKNCKIPVLVIVGESDKLTPVKEAELISKEFPNCELHIIQGSGHLSNLERPLEFNSILNKFLLKYNE